LTSMFKDAKHLFMSFDEYKKRWYPEEVDNEWLRVAYEIDCYIFDQVMKLRILKFRNNLNIWLEKENKCECCGDDYLISEETEGEFEDGCIIVTKADINRLRMIY